MVKDDTDHICKHTKQVIIHKLNQAGYSGWNTTSGTSGANTKRYLAKTAAKFLVDVVRNPGYVDNEKRRERMGVQSNNHTFKQSLEILEEHGFIKWKKKSRGEISRTRLTKIFKNKLRVYHDAVDSDESDEDGDDEEYKDDDIEDGDIDVEFADNSDEVEKLEDPKNDDADDGNVGGGNGEEHRAEEEDDDVEKEDGDDVEFEDNSDEVGEPGNPKGDDDNEDGNVDDDGNVGPGNDEVKRTEEEHDDDEEEDTDDVNRDGNTDVGVEAKTGDVGDAVPYEQRTGEDEDDDEIEDVSDDLEEGTHDFEIEHNELWVDKFVLELESLGNANRIDGDDANRNDDDVINEDDDVAADSIQDNSSKPAAHANGVPVVTPTKLTVANTTNVDRGLVSIRDAEMAPLRQLEDDPAEARVEAQVPSYSYHHWSGFE